MKIYGIDKHTNFDIHENVVLCATVELAEQEVLRLQKEDEYFWTETETFIRKETKDPLFVSPSRGNVRYKITELELKEDQKMSKRKYPADYKGPKAGESSDEEWLAVRWYNAYINVLNGTWTYSDFDCFCAALERSGEGRALEALKEFHKRYNIKAEVKSWYKND